MQTHLETILVIETSLDDASPQVVGSVLEQALEMGALDAYATPIQMKKNRPGVLVTLLVQPQERQAMVELLLRETTSLGVRVAECQREVVERHWVSVNTRYGVIRIKVATLGAETVPALKAAPEFEDCRAAARRHGVPVREVLQTALAAFSDSPPPQTS